MDAVRGGEIAMIFQEPMAAFSPVHTIGNQLLETIRLHQGLSGRAARELSVDLLKRVGMTDPARRFHQYAFELSGGMRQRAMIATALAGNPRLLIADEPTTALDVTIQAQILELLLHVQGETGMAILFITHDLGVIAQLADTVAVMYLGKVVEYGSKRAIFQRPRHPYTVNLLNAVMRARQGEDETRTRLVTIPGQIPSPFDRPRGCPYHTRCAQRIAGVCDLHEPALTALDSEQSVACVLYTS
jgi:oligopeptide/dipeptide ABC transporter ATP-binding protein